ncbi:MAG: superoxide dismutase [Cu-Zn] SodC [Usitatibacter sp.]
MNRTPALASLSLFAATPVLADYAVEMNAIDIRGVGASLGFVTVAAAPSGGVVFAPNLRGLPPGSHGFHVHEFANCGAREKDGKMTAGDMAGEHFDPQKTRHHAGPAGKGHLGDLPPLEVAADGTAIRQVIAPRLALRDLANKSLVIHQGGDNGTDAPPNGGGGARIACGVVQPGRL